MDALDRIPGRWVIFDRDFTQRCGESRPVFMWPMVGEP